MNGVTWSEIVGKNRSVDNTSKIIDIWFINMIQLTTTKQNETLEELIEKLREQEYDEMSINEQESIADEEVLHDDEFGENTLSLSNRQGVYDFSWKEELHLTASQHAIESIKH